MAHSQFFQWLHKPKESEYMKADDDSSKYLAGKPGETPMEFNVRRIMAGGGSAPATGRLRYFRDEFQAYYENCAETYEEFIEFLDLVLAQPETKRFAHHFGDEYRARAKKYFDMVHQKGKATVEPYIQPETESQHQEQPAMNAADNNTDKSNTESTTDANKESTMNKQAQTTDTSAEKKSMFATIVYWIFMAMFVAIVLPVYAVGMLAFFFVKHVGMGAYFAVYETGKTSWVKARALYKKTSAWVKNLFAKKADKEVKAAATPAAEAPAAA